MRSPPDDAPKTTGEKTIDALTDLGPELLTTIGERRNKRKNPLIMIADDDHISCILAGNVIGREYDWFCVEDGRHALIEYVVKAPDAVVLDIGLPDINGHTILSCIERIDPAAHVIMFSRHNDEGNVALALKEGASGFIAKPFSRDKMRQYIDCSPHLADKRGIKNIREWKVS